MSISRFDDLLALARTRRLPERVLFVFVQTTVQHDYDTAERGGFEHGDLRRYARFDRDGDAIRFAGPPGEN